MAGFSDVINSVGALSMVRGRFDDVMALLGDNEQPIDVRLTGLSAYVRQHLSTIEEQRKLEHIKCPGCGCINPYMAQPYVDLKIGLFDAPTVGKIWKAVGSLDPTELLDIKSVIKLVTGIDLADDNDMLSIIGKLSAFRPPDEGMLPKVLHTLSRGNFPVLQDCIDCNAPIHLPFKE